MIITHIPLHQVFDLHQCYEEMQRQASESCAAVAAQTAAVRGQLNTAVNITIDPNLAKGIGVDDLRRYHCGISLLVKTHSYCLSTNSWIPPHSSVILRQERKILKM